jgi:Ca2+-binding EF-hand superfamily protein
MRRLLVLSSLLALAAGASAQIPGPGFGGGRGPGGPGGPGGGFGLLQFDTNADGKLTRAEFDAGQRKAFAEMDGNKDGSATPDEIRAGREAQAKTAREAAQKARFTEMDKDRNGQLSQAEFMAPLQQAEADRAARKDGPGRDGPRMGGGRGMRGPGGPGGQGGPGMMFGGPDGPGRGGPPMMMGGRGPRGDRGGPPGAPGAQAPQAGAQAQAQGQSGRPMRAGPLDADNDGKLTFAEFTARANEAFTRADTNKDGTITIAELQANAGFPR